MRKKLRAEGESKIRGTSPREMLTELYSDGAFSREEFQRLEKMFRLRNEIVHGFAPPAIDPVAIQFLIENAAQLMAETQTAG